MMHFMELHYFFSKIYGTKKESKQKEKLFGKWTQVAWKS